MNGKQSGGMTMPFFQRGQTEKFSGGAAENLGLVLKQMTALISLGVWCVVVIATGLWMIGPALPIGAVSGVCLVAGYVGVRFVKARLPEPSWALAIVAVVCASSFALLTGTQIVLDNWPALCTWRWEAKAIIWCIQVVVLEALWLTRYRFKYEIVDPKAQPTFQPRPGEGGIRWPESPLDGIAEGLGEFVDDEPVTLPHAAGNGERATIVNPAKKPMTANQQFAYDLRDFIKRGSMTGFARSSWIQPDKPRLRLWPTGNQVRRALYDNLMKHLRDGGVITNGDAPQLRVPLDQALAAIKDPPTPA